jgi:hypothetical protein
MMSWRIVIPAVLFCMGVSAQFTGYRDPAMPRLKDGKVNLSAPAPRAGGKPDLSGVWMHDPTPPAELKRLFGAIAGDELDTLPPGMNIEVQNKYGFDMLIDYDEEVFRNLKPGQPPPTQMPLMRPDGTAFMAKKRSEGIPDNCHGENYGWPVAGMLSEAIKIVQAPKETMILYEVGDLHREIFTDGRKFPAVFDLPAFMGYSIGRWEGDTFVVESRGFNDKTPIDGMGHPRSEDMHVTERFVRRDYGHLDMEITFEDPKFYTKAFTVRIPHTLAPDYDVLEMFCENEKDNAHIKK